MQQVFTVGIQARVASITGLITVTVVPLRYGGVPSKSRKSSIRDPCQCSAVLLLCLTCLSLLRQEVFLSPFKARVII